MKISELDRRQVREQLKGTGLLFQTGPFVTSLRSPFKSVADGIHLLYGDCDLHEPPSFADFHITVEPPRGLRRWFRPQVNFDFDGEVPFRPLPAAQAFPAFEWGLNWCITSTMHNHLIIHSAVVEREGFALLLPGAPGSGKSTLCAALINRGWRLLSDELTLVEPHTLRLTPVPRPVSLKNESIQVIRKFAPDAVMSSVVRDTGKGTVAHMKAPAESVARWRDASLPAWIIFPGFESGAAPRMSPHAKARAFMELAEHSFNFNVLGSAGFQTLKSMIDRCSCHDFKYGELGDAVSMLGGLEAPAHA